MGTKQDKNDTHDQNAPATSGAPSEQIASILQSARQAADTERARAREAAAAIISGAEAEARGIRDSAAEEVAAQLTAAAEIRQAAEQDRVAAELRAAEVIGQAEAERECVATEIEADRAAARASLQGMIVDLQAAMARLDGSAIEPSATPVDDEPAPHGDTPVSDSEPLTMAVRSAIARAISAPVMGPG